MRCTSCGATLGAGAGWCGLCHAPVPAAAVVTAPPLSYAARSRLVLAGGAPVWAPPVDLAPPPLAPHAKAGRTVVLAIAVGAASQGLLWLLTRSRTVENEAAVRYALVTTLLVYAMVAVIVVRRRYRDPSPLRWSVGNPYTGGLLGLVVGGGLAAFLLAVNAAAGQPGGDPRVVLLVSEGDVGHILGTVLICVIAAPLLEELLFRGLLAESLVPRSKRAAVWISAAAFAAWHLNPGALKYYALMGALLAGLFVRRGLVCSIATHAAFNGALTVAAIAYALAPGALVTGPGITLRAPHGWHDVHDGYAVHLRGPSAAEVVVLEVPAASAVSADTLLDRAQRGDLPTSGAFAIVPGTARTQDLPAGQAVRMRITSEGRDGEVAFVVGPQRTYVIALASGGSVRVRADFDRILRDLSLSA